MVRKNPKGKVPKSTLWYFTIIITVLVYENLNLHIIRSRQMIFGRSSSHIMFCTCIGQAAAELDACVWFEVSYLVRCGGSA